MRIFNEAASWLIALAGHWMAEGRHSQETGWLEKLDCDEANAAIGTTCEGWGWERRSWRPRLGEGRGTYSKLASA